MASVVVLAGILHAHHGKTFSSIVLTVCYSPSVPIALLSRVEDDPQCVGAARLPAGRNIFCIIVNIIPVSHLNPSVDHNHHQHNATMLLNVLCHPVSVLLLLLLMCYY